MKKATLLFYFLTFAFFSFAQNTWIKRLSNFSMGSYQHSDNLTGIKCLEIGADGSIYAIGNFGQDNSQGLIKITSNGVVEWGESVGFHGGLTGAFANSVRPTSDSGCIITTNFWGQSAYFHIDGNVQKYSKTGTLEWSAVFNGFGQGPQAENEAYDAIEIGNYYYAFVGDSVIKFDPSGNILSYDSTCKFPLQKFPNGDLLISQWNELSREDSSGNVIWSSSVSGNCGCPSTFYYVYIDSTVSKMALADGSLLWTKSYPWPISSLDSTADGGFVASFGYAPDKIYSIAGSTANGKILRADSAGNTLWSRTYTFPQYGLPRIKIHPTSQIVTGGGWILTDRLTLNYSRDYSSFIATLDSSGNGILETESYIWPGDANNNLYLDFVDDAPDIGIAWNATGIARDDSSIAWPGPPGYFSDFAADWTDTFSTGVNYKHADFNGDGIIDMDDLTPYANVSWTNLQNWRNTQPHTFNTIADLSILPEKDTVDAGDTITFSIILGSSFTPVDSLYTFAFSSYYPSNPLDSAAVVNYSSSDFGNPGIDVITYDFKTDYGFDYGLSLMMSKNDHMNVYQLHDTLARIYIKTKSSLSPQQTFRIIFQDAKAVTLSGSLVLLNLISGEVVIRPSYLKTGEIEKDVILVFPNPVSEILTVNSPAKVMKTFEVMNAQGQIVETFDGKGMIRINVKDYPEGIFLLKTISEQGISTVSFIVRH